MREATPEEKIAYLEAENSMLRNQFEETNRYMKKYEILSGFTEETLENPHYLSSKELHVFKQKGLEAFYIYLKGKIDALDEEREKKFGFKLPKK